MPFLALGKKTGQRNQSAAIPRTCPAGHLPTKSEIGGFSVNACAKTVASPVVEDADIEMTKEIVDPAKRQGIAA
ncbi:hypothetical protein FJ930_11225 [Mesorhizobium sp. B2-4-15]|uniref:hypothetical protein n=1 Tax=Mesorhizobium sp. B2-4-15 TaxID=2589934 RepID=UPI00114EA9F1|nr:hypothetical protein [Mesorhizobium sp. B2-4-15]TPK73058.1 hypothetical protein FJ930_11225 [Mesorhizobium sp. B2-4-15]